ncbi:hypothetical protein K523DRAFT_359068 [Schizophyllum commune Tattone D]|nr:hypothetical protein K523DRAFT_359068 [Schizophyllum commune Tattone D]
MNQAIKMMSRQTFVYLGAELQERCQGLLSQILAANQVCHTEIPERNVWYLGGPLYPMNHLLDMV